RVREIVEAEPERRGDLYIRGFLLTDDPGIDEEGPPFYGAWSRIQLGRYHLYVHPVESWFTLEHEGRQFFLVGHAYNPFAMEHDENRILESVARAAASGTRAMLDVIDELSG